MSTTVHTVGVAGGDVVAGNIAARIDRLPLIWVQYLLAAITQIYWGIIIDADGFISRIYPFVWQPLGMTVVEFSVILASNIGAGILVGEYLGGYLSDRFGRRSVLLASAVIVGGLMWPIALTNSTGWLLLWNFTYAIGMGFMLATNAVYLHEVAPPGTRHRLAMRTQLLTAVCGLLPSVLAFALIPARYQWFVYGLALAQFVILIPLGLLLPESPRWLESKGRVHEADRIVTRWERWAERRRGPLPEPAAERHPVVQVRRVPARELFRGEYGRRTVLVLAVWLIGYPGIVYGGVTYIVTYLAGHGWSAPEVFLWTGIVAAPMRVLGFVACSFLGERVGRAQAHRVRVRLPLVALLPGPARRPLQGRAGDPGPLQLPPRRALAVQHVQLHVGRLPDPAAVRGHRVDRRRRAPGHVPGPARDRPAVRAHRRAEQLRLDPVGRRVHADPLGADRPLWHAATGGHPGGAVDLRLQPGAGRRGRYKSSR